MVRHLYLLPVCLFFALAGCGSGDPAPAKSVDVYAAGYQIDSSGYYHACYWKNKSLTVLNPGPLGSRADSIAVSGSDVYVAGSVNNGTHSVATIWKNGVPTSLADGTSDSATTSIALENGNVYVAGYQQTPDPSRLIGVTTEYWVNGTPVVLAKGINEAPATSIFIAGTDVYVSGSTYVTTQVSPNNYISNSAAQYWKNGKATKLTDGLNFAVANSVFASGTQVYVAGETCLMIAPNCGHAAIWKNGNMTLLTPATPSSANSVFVDNNDVYVTGNTNLSSGSNTAEYWKNGNPTELLTGSYAYAAQVVVAGNDVYVGGVGFYGACVWKNGTAINLTAGPASASAVTSIAIA